MRLAVVKPANVNAFFLILALDFGRRARVFPRRPPHLLRQHTDAPRHYRDRSGRRRPPHSHHRRPHRLQEEDEGRGSHAQAPAAPDGQPGVPGSAGVQGR